MLPDWAPNIHPLIVHFPIALLLVAALIDFVGVWVRKSASVRWMATTLYTLGALTAFAALRTGEQAADMMNIPAMAQTTLTSHADWAHYTLYFFGGYALVRLIAGFADKKNRLGVSLPLFLIGAGGMFLVYQTAEHGGELVYAHGIGVQAVKEAPSPFAALAAPTDSTAATMTPEAGPLVASDGSWQWLPGVQDLPALPAMLTFAEGSPDAVRFSLVAGDADYPTPLALDLEGQSVLMTLGPDSLSSIQAEYTFNADAFNGRVTMVHHVQDAQNYHFLSLESGQLRQGIVADGIPTVLDSTPHDVTGWVTLRAVADRTHFRGYQDGALLVHGHGDEPANGPVGLRLEGTGQLKLAKMEVIALR